MTQKIDWLKYKLWQKVLYPEKLDISFSEKETKIVS